MIYTQLSSAPSGDSTFDIVARSRVGWRRAEQMPERFGSFEFLRSRGSRDATGNRVGLPAQ